MLLAQSKLRSACFTKKRNVSRFICKASNFNDHDKEHEAKLGPNVLKKVGDLNAQQFTSATVTRNDALNLDGSARLLHLSVPDSPTVLYGRKVRGVVDSSRWIDDYTSPGQFVALRLPGQPACKRLFSIASTPYEVRRDSSYIGASLIEVVAERVSGEDDLAVSDLGPGAEIEVSQVIGRGFSPVLSAGGGVMGALEADKPILTIGVGLRGMVPLRAALSWVPVLAHATKRKVSCLYVTSSATSAAFIPEWDSWREAGVYVHPVYTGPELNVDAMVVDGEGRGMEKQEAQVVGLVEQAMFLREDGFDGLVGDPKEVVVLMSGMTKGVSSSLSKTLTNKGIKYDRQLFAGA